MNFDKLIQNIRHIDEIFSRATANSIKQNLILRNWLFGWYIIEFEQKGKDFAKYGERLLYELASSLKQGGLKGISYTNLTLFRKLYLYYPQIGVTFNNFNLLPDSVYNLQTSEDLTGWSLPANLLLENLSFSHLVELLKVPEREKRLFYEIECIKGTWSIRQLNRQIGSFLYERTGFSYDKEALLSELKEENLQKPEFIIRDPYVFEFLGLKQQEVFQEKDLEKALLDHLQSFLLELGAGFCFEARQKSFLIDNRRYQVDLLFYHKVLKCAILIDLKLGEFTYEAAGQMNFYLNYYKEHEALKGDNPPIGIILCSYKNEAVVKYATGGLDNQLFVSRYLLQLPSAEYLRQFLLEQQKKI